ncbi:hypothetical protein Dimus_001358, partial [Dionaea muscipula]
MTPTSESAATGHFLRQARTLRLWRIFFALGLPNGKDETLQPLGSNKMVKAIPKSEAEEDMKSGVQKFRVKLLLEGFGRNDMDVLCR